MAGNSFGKHFKITTFGESHGMALGVIIDGLPAGLRLNMDEIQWELDKRKPGQSKVSSMRKEDDLFEIVSGVFEGKTTGAPLCAFIKNADAKERDYVHLQLAWRPSHADFTWDAKFGFRDYRGGGRSSARETVARVFAGAIAKQYLDSHHIKIQAYVSQVGAIQVTESYQNLDLNLANENLVRCPDPQKAALMIEKILEVRREGDTIGGVVSCVISGCPAGLGEPIFDKLSATLAQAMMSIPAAKAFEYGSGFSGVEMRGSEHNDIFYMEKGQVKTKTNRSGGIQGGISNGMDIYFRVAFKPVATILQPQSSIDTQGKETIVLGKGRHDPCVVPRAAAVVEAMAALVVMDFLLRSKTDQWR